MIKENAILMKAFLLAMAVIAASILILAFAAPASAQELGLDAELEAELEALLSGEEEVAIYEFQEIAPEYAFSLGYTFVANNGPKSIGRYYYLESSPSFGASARLFSYPTRFFLELDVTNKWDSFTELRYAYGDTFLFRWVNVRMYHNYEILPVRNLDTGTPSIDVDVSGCDSGCGSGTSIYKALLRYKTPGYPAHFFLKFHYVGRETERQDIHLGGAGSFNEIVRVSEENDATSYFVRYEAGANAHIGPVEGQYTLTRQYFEPDDETHSSYLSGNYAWAAGNYPLNIDPKVEGNSHTFKIHTSYTGKLVAAATLSIKELKNETSGAKSDHFHSMASVTWMPITKLTFVARYTHYDMQVDNPSKVNITDMSNPVNSYNYVVKPSISYVKDKIHITGRYRPGSKVTFLGRYEVERTDRDNAEQWGLDSSITTKHKAGLELRARLNRSLNVKAEAERLDIVDPAYNSEPDSENMGRMSVSWSPLPWLSANAAYMIRQGERSSLDFDGITNARDRETSDEHTAASVNFLINEDATVTVGYFMLRSYIKQDIVYEKLRRDFPGTHMVSHGVVQEDECKGYNIGLSYRANEKLSLYAGASYSTSNASFLTNNQDLLQPISLASLSDFEYSETAFNVSGDYSLSNKSSLSLEYKFRTLDESLDNPNDGIS
ncbi:MAG TPA: hypothetical protein ENI12_01695, partial [Nitrospirae bacterium]|nr:hypothetical protein [Nitrospirota bacterium]